MSSDTGDSSNKFHSVGFIAKMEFLRHLLGPIARACNDKMLTTDITVSNRMSGSPYIISDQCSLRYSTRRVSKLL